MNLKWFRAWRSDVASRKALFADVAVRQYADAVLGERNAHLLRAYGRVMSGPNAGQYVSGIAPTAAKLFVDALLRGDEIAVHLMHRHRSGIYESSSLRLVDGKFLMRFQDREEIA